MDEVVRVILSCRDRRQAFALGRDLMRDGLVSGMNFGVGSLRETWKAGRRSDSDVPLVLSTLDPAVPFLEVRVLELHPDDPPPLVGRVREPPASRFAAFVRAKIVLPVLH